MIILGVHGNVLNVDGVVNESSACIVKDGEIIAAVAEERISRLKVDGKFPYQAIEEVLKIADISIDNVDYVACTTIHPYENSKKYLDSAISTFKDTGVMLKNKLKSFGYFTLYNKLKAKKEFNITLLNKTFTVEHNDHHYCHAAGAYYASPFDDALVITLDGGGDGLDGGAYIGHKASLNRFIEIPHFQSPGTMYSALTHDLGFKRHRHEGKITGLAAYGNPDPKRLHLEDLLKYDPNKKRFISKQVAAHHKDLLSKSDYFYPLLSEHSKEDLAAVTQAIFEDEVVNFVVDAYNTACEKGHKPKNICLAGGCFANVKANQKIFDTQLFDDIFVFTAMGDDGLSVGAALMSYYRHSKSSGKSHSQIEHTYFGPEFSDEEIKSGLDEYKLKYERYDDVEEKIGELLADGKIVARFNGRMEYGPRALGNRSILGAPFDSDINNWLNEKLNRTEFMPFAPSILEEYANDYLVNYGDEKAAEFMTMTYDIKPGMKEKIPAVVHIDNTARPQIVKKTVNESYHKIITSFYNKTKIPVVLNTSFNMHEEPIVRSPSDAIRGFIDGKLDYLAIGNYIATNH